MSGSPRQFLARLALGLLATACSSYSAASADDPADASTPDAPAVVADASPPDATGTDTGNVGTDANRPKGAIVALPASGLVTTEAGGRAQVSIFLSSKPSSFVTIALTSKVPTEATVPGAPLIFTSATWDTPQVVEITGVNDTKVDGDVAFALEAIVSATDDEAYKSATPVTVSGVNRDDDKAAIVISPLTGLSVIESGTTTTFAVSLTAEPKANVTIAVASSDVSEVSVSPSVVEFTPANWSTPKVVTLTGVDDAISDGPKVVTITTAPAVSSDLAYSGQNPDDVAVTNVDNDMAGFAVTPTSGLSVSETGTTATFTVALLTKPTASVTFPIASSAVSAATVSPASLTFTTTNYATPQTVTITGVDDQLADGLQNFTIVLGAATSTDSNYNGANPADVSGATIDDDIAGVTVTPSTAVSVSETGTTATFTVVLRAAPSSNVTIPVSSSDIKEATVSPATLAFTTQNWNTPQTVTVTGIDDHIADGTRPFTIVLGAATSADTAYNGFKANDVLGNTIDDDVAAITVTQSAVTMSEAGGSTTFSVFLQTSPTANVIVPVTSSNVNAATVSPSTLTFTGINYAVPQTVTITAVNDFTGDGNKTLSIVLGAATSGDTSYNGVKPADVSALTLDDDNADVTLTASGTPISGSYHACIRSTIGNLKCWGRNVSGELGLGDANSRGDDPGEMGATLPTINLGTGRTALAVTTGVYHTCAILDTKQVKCWGYNSFGELGVGSTTFLGDGPGEMGDALPVVNLGTGRTAKVIAAGNHHTCAILDNSSVKCWGYNWAGQLGLGDTTTRGRYTNEMGDALPTVNLGTGRTATQIVIGELHTCAILDNGSVKCWGPNAEGQLGLGDTATRGDGPGEMGDSLAAVNLGTGRTALSIAAGWNHTCVLLDNSRMKCWGNNQYGRLGQGDTNHRGDAAGEMGDSLPLIDLGTGRTVLMVGAGINHSCALLDNYTAKCWGGNSNGENGLGDVVNRGDNANEMGDSLSAINIGTGRSFRTLSTGFATICARLDDGRSKCWGYNAFGILGLGDNNRRGDNANEMGDNLPFLDWVP